MGNCLNAPCSECVDLHTVPHQILRGGTPTSENIASWHQRLTNSPVPNACPRGDEKEGFVGGKGLLGRTGGSGDDAREFLRLRPGEGCGDISGGGGGGGGGGRIGVFGAGSASAGRFLLQGEKVAGSVRQGKVCEIIPPPGWLGWGGVG